MRRGPLHRGAPRRRAPRLPLASPHLRRRLGSVLAVVLVASGLAVASLALPRPPAAQAALALDCGSVYALQGLDPRNIWNVNTGTGGLTSTGTFSIGSTATTNLNGLGIQDDGSAVYGVLPANSGTGRTVYRHLRSTEATTALGAGAASAPVTHGAVNPVNNFYYYGGFSSTGTGTGVLSVYGFNTATNASLGLVAQGSIPAGGANGDWAFDQLGRLYVTGGSGNTGAANTNIFTSVNETIPSTAVSTPVALTGTQISSISTPAGQAINGIAFAGSGLVYLASQQQLFEVRANTGAVLNTRTLSTQGASVDLASCARPSTIVVQKDFGSFGRVDASDQATVTVSGDNLGSGNTSGTTTGTETGLQNQVASEYAGPVFGTSGTTYTISESGSGTREASSTQAGYTRAWRCVNATNGNALVAEGTGTSGQFTMPASGSAGANVVCTFTNTAQVARLTLEKTASAPSGSTPGSTITYTFRVTNTGSVPLTGVSVNDPKVGPVTCGTGSLAVGATRTCTQVTYAVTQADINTGRVDNTATATGTAAGLPNATGTASVSTPITQTPSLQLTKTAGTPTDSNGNGLVDTGDRIPYSFAVVNNGNVPVTGLAINDAKVGATTCSATSLAVGASTTCTTNAAYTVTAADQTAGAVTNTATASGTGPQGGTVTSNRSSTTTPLTAPRPELTLVKTAGTPVDRNGSTITDAGDTVAYTFRVTNSGNVPVTGLAINDAKVGATTCPVTSLAVGAATTCSTVTPYVVTTADQTAGAVANSATASATATGSGAVTSAASTARVAVATPNPALSVVKRAAAPVDRNASGITDTGDTIAYTFTVTNTGNVPISSVAIDDPLLARQTPAITVSCTGTGALAPSGTRECTASRAYTVTDDDEVAGRVVNTATATGTNPDGGTVRSAVSSVTTTVTQARPSLGVVKRVGAITDANGSGITDAGDTIAYGFTVTNTGNVPVRGVAISDVKLAGVTIRCDATTLAPGASTTCATVSPYTVTAADEAAGVVTNTARATGTDPDGATTTSDPSTAQVPTTAQSAVLTLTKSAGDPVDVNGSGTIDAGDTVAYRFVVRNDGNVPVQSLSIIDARAGPVTCAATTLAVGASTTCTPTALYTITTADESAGVAVNTATAQARAPRGEPNLVTSNRSSTTTGPVVAPAPSIAVDKRVLSVTDSNGSGITDAGDRITYDFVVTNTGNVPLTGVTVTDPLYGAGAITCPQTRLAAGATMTCTAPAYVVTAADEAAGSVATAATARGTGPAPRSQVVSATDDTSTPTTRPVTTIGLTKTAASPVDANSSGLVDAGDTVRYSFRVTNTGNVPLRSLAIADPLLSSQQPAIGVTCESLTLAPGASTACAADRALTITEADERAGRVVNTATANALDPNGTRRSSPEASVTTTVVTPRPAATIAKSASTPLDRNDNGVADAGDTIAYTFTFTNTGDVPLRGFAVSDPLVGRVDCPATTLAPGGTKVCRAAALYTITAADVAAGSVVNTATGSALDPDGLRVAATGTASTSTPLTAPAPSLTIEKTAGTPVDVNDSGLTDAGDTVDFSFVVTNTGNVPVDEVAVDDPVVGTVTCGVTTLAPGASTTCTSLAPVVLTPADEAAGSYDNSATAVGRGRGGERVRSAADTTSTVVATPEPALELDKVAGDPVDVNGSGITDAGDTIDYTFTVTNTGNVPVSSVAIDDPRLTGLTCAATTLQPGGPGAEGSSTTCTADTYVVTAADEVAVAVVNVATATGTDPDGGSVESPSDRTSTPTTIPDPALTLDKRLVELTDADDDGIADPGDRITYGFTVTNTGNVPVRDLVVDDPRLSAAGITVTCDAAPLAPGASRECTASAPYTVTTDDLPDEVVTNTATVTGRGPDNAAPAPRDVESDPDTVNVPVTPEARVLTLTKTASEPVDANDSGIPDAGDEVTYTFTVTNDGNVPITDVAIDDAPLGDLPITCTATTLQPGAETTCTSAPYVLTADDAAAGEFVNVATATGTGPQGDAVASNEARSTVTPVIASAPAVRVEKRASAPVDVNDSGITDAGDTITYTFLVTNTGNVPLADVTVSDPRLGAGAVTCPPERLAAGDTVTCSADDYVVTTADENTAGDGTGAVVNTARASGTGPGPDSTRVTSPADDPASTTRTPTERPAPSLALTKRVDGIADDNGSGLRDAGDTIRYRFDVTNDGNVPITVLQVVDPKVGTVACENITIAVGDTFTCAPVVDYRVTAADEAAGSVDNTAFARGEDPDDQLVRSPNSTTSTRVVTPRPEVVLTKSASVDDVNGSGLTDAGDVVTYTFTVTNTGDVPVTRARVIDPLVAGGTCTPADLPAPSAADPEPSTTCTATDTYTITEADETAGEVVNTATARVRDPDDEIVDSAPASATVPVSVPAPSLAIVKTADDPVDVNGSGLTDAGDTVQYRFTVTNTGDVPLGDVAVSDPLLEGLPTPIGITCAADGLTVSGPGSSTTCTADGPYTITQGDEVTGEVVNTARATAVDPDDVEVVSAPDREETPVATPAPSLALEKAADVEDLNDSGLTDTGDEVTYTFTVINTGDVPLTAPAVSDDLLAAAGITVSCPAVTLAVGDSPSASTTCTADAAYVVTADDTAAGVLSNTATASALDPDDETVDSDPDTVRLVTTPGTPVLTLDKVAADPVDVNDSGITDRGDTIAYTFTVTNDGNVPVRALAIDDPLLAGQAPPVGVGCDALRLEPGDVTTCRADAPYVVTAADETAGAVVNSATATGLDPDGGPVESNLDETTTPVSLQAPALGLVKTAADPVDVNGSGLVDAGDTIAYTFAVTNLGNVPVTDLRIDDPVLAGATTPVGTTCAATSLAVDGPGASTTCRADAPYVVTEADEAAGAVVNTATAVATDPDTEEVASAPSTTTTPVATPAPRLTIVKTADAPVDVDDSGTTDVGDTVLYRFTVTNTGNVPLRDVGVADDLLAPPGDAGAGVTCEDAPGADPAVLLPDESVECVADEPYVIDDADVVDGAVTNTATATATDPDGGDVASESDSTRTPVVGTELALTIDKSAAVDDVNDSGNTDAGDEIAYTFVVTNGSNVTLRTLRVVDDLLADAGITVVCEATRLPAGGVTTCAAEASYVVTDADEAAGSVDNTATAQALAPSTPAGGDPEVSAPDSTATPVVPPGPALRLVKTAEEPVDVNGSGLVDAGDEIAYSFAVSNTGNVPVRSLAVVDPLLADSDPAVGVTCQDTVLAAGASTTCTTDEPYVVTEADEAAGEVVNSATVEGVDPDGDDVASGPSGTLTEVADPAPEVTLTKAAAATDVNGSGLTDAGDTIAFTFTVTNTGDVPLRGVSVDDAFLAGLPTPIGVTCEASDVPGVLAVDETVTCAADAAYVVTDADELAGSVDNAAVARTVDPDGDAVVSDEVTTSTPTAVPDPELTLDKAVAPGGVDDVNGNGVTDAGDTVAFTFTVTNTGTVPLTEVTVDDPLLAGQAPPITIDCGEDPLGPGDERTCEASAPYTITAGDETERVVRNTATARGTDPDDDEVTSDPDTVSVPVTDEAAVLTLDKRAADPVDVNDSGLTDAGDTIAYTFTVTNDGNTRVDDVAVVDPLLDGATPPVTVACDATSLAPGASTECEAEASYVVTAGDERAGEVVNTATATGTSPTGADVVSNEDATRTPVTAPSPGLTLTKSAGEPVDRNGSGLTDAGDTIAYTFRVTNAGDVPLDAVTVADPLLDAAGIGVTCDAAATRLLPSRSVDCAADAPYVVTADDEAAGSVVNTATATALDPDDGEVLSPEASTSTPTQQPTDAISVVKTAADPVDVNSSGLTDAGDTIAYSFTVTNDGTVPLRSVTVVDPLLDAQSPPVTITCDATTLAPGASETCTADAPYVVNAVDELAGEVVNTARATGVDPDGDDVTSEASTTTTPVSVPDPALAIVKSADVTDLDGSGITDAGDEVVYSFEVTNTGDVPVDEVVVVDPLLADLPTPVGVTCDETVLAPGATTACVADAPYVVTDADETAGLVRNTATAEGTDPDGDPVVSDPDTVNTPTTPDAAVLTLDKRVTDVQDTNGSGITDAGDRVRYQFTLTNDGNVPLTQIAVDDPMLSGARPGPVTVTCGRDSLAVGASAVCTSGLYTVTAADERDGEVRNVATATGRDPQRRLVRSNEDSTRIPVTVPDRSLSLVKTADAPVDVNGSGLVDAGDEITYRFTVTNRGNVPVTVLRVDDPLLADQDDAVTAVCGPTELDPGESSVCVADGPYVVTEADEAAGEVVNTGVATAIDPDGDPVASPPARETTPISTPAPALEVVKTAEVVDDNASGLTDAGDEIRYSFTVTNTGTVPVAGIGVDDPLLAEAGIGVRCEADRLPAPSAGTPAPSTTCAADAPYVVTEADEAAGSVENSAVATGTDPDGDPVASDADATSTPVSTPDPALVMVKNAGVPRDVDGSGLVDAGDEIDYTFTVTNTGDVPLFGVDITDALLESSGVAVRCAERTLPATATTTCTSVAPYVVTAADEAAGEVVNTATAVAQDPDGEAVESSGSSTRTEVGVPAPLLELLKSAAVVDTDADGTIGAGDEITYTFEVTNTGNVGVSDVVVDDPLLAEVGTVVRCDATTLSAGASTTCRAAAPYVITAADVTAGEVRNAATVDGTDPSGDPVGSNTSITLTPTGTAAAALVLDKSAVVDDVNGNGVTDAGDRLTYTFEVTNIGDVTITQLLVQDSWLRREGIGVTCPTRTLPAGESTVCTADAPYVVIGDDEESGQVVNTAYATGVRGRGDGVVESPPAVIGTPVRQEAGRLTLDKQGVATDLDGDGVIGVGDRVDYSFVVRNVGDVVVSDVTIDDPLLGGGVTCPTTTLEPDEETTCTASYVVGDADVERGEVVNTATATGELPGGGTVLNPPTDTVTTPTPGPEPALTLDKRAAAPRDLGGDGIGVDDEIDYSFTVTNTGTVRLTDVGVDDDLVDVTCDATVLAPGESTECAATYAITAADLRAGRVVNTATADGTAPDGSAVVSAPDSTRTRVPSDDGDPDDPDGPGTDPGEEPPPGSPPGTGPGGDAPPVGGTAPTSPGGILPDTGGPAALVALLGLLMTGLGIGVLSRSRRRKDA